VRHGTLGFRAAPVGTCLLFASLLHKERVKSLEERLEVHALTHQEVLVSVIDEALDLMHVTRSQAGLRGRIEDRALDARRSGVSVHTARTMPDLMTHRGEDSEELGRMTRRPLHVHDAHLHRSLGVDAHGPPAPAGIVAESAIMSELLEMLRPLDVRRHEPRLDREVLHDALARVAPRVALVMARTRGKRHEHRDERTQAVQDPDRLFERTASVVTMKAGDPASTKDLARHALGDTQVALLGVHTRLEREPGHRVRVDREPMHGTELVQPPAHPFEIMLDLGQARADAGHALDLLSRKLGLDLTLVTDHRHLAQKQLGRDDLESRTFRIDRPVLFFRAEASLIARIEDEFIAILHFLLL